MGKLVYQDPEMSAEVPVAMLTCGDGKQASALGSFTGGSILLISREVGLGMTGSAGDAKVDVGFVNPSYLKPVHPAWRNCLLGAPLSRRPVYHRGWYSRNYLPHFDEPGYVQSITFRLADAVPAEIVAAWKAALNLRGTVPVNDPRSIELHRRLEKYEDAGHGACWLRDERIAAIVESALLHFDGERYRLLAWCVMPNHVHVLIEVKSGFLLADIVHSWKSFTANESNRILGRKGTFWQREYFDRFIRDEKHLQASIEYIEQNPVKAGLVRSPEQWRFSSAYLRKREDAAGAGSQQDAGAPSD